MQVRRRLAAMAAGWMPAQSQGRLRVLADTPLRPALLKIGEAFHHSGGAQQVEFVFDASPVILEKLAAGETFDVVIVQPDHITDLMKAGTVVPGFRSHSVTHTDTHQPTLHQRLPATTMCIGVST